MEPVMNYNNLLRENNLSQPVSLISEPQHAYPQTLNNEHTPPIRLLEQCIIQTSSMTAVVRVFGVELST